MTFSWKKKKPVEFSDIKKLRVLFHRDARGLPTHGGIVVSHVDYALDNNPVRFNFIGLSRPPVLNLDVMNHLFAMAEEQGYVVHHLISYGTVIDPNPASDMTDIIQASAVSAVALPGIPKNPSQ